MGGIQGILSLVGRLVLCSLFVFAAVHKILDFEGNLALVVAEGVPMPKVALGVAIGCLLLGSTLVILGYKTRFGAFLLLLFLGAAAYFFHDFWTIEDVEERAMQMGHFLTNVALMGAMLYLVANGGGAWSIDGCCRKPSGDEPAPTT